MKIIILKGFFNIRFYNLKKLYSIKNYGYTLNTLPKKFTSILKKFTSILSPQKHNLYILATVLNFLREKKVGKFLYFLGTILILFNLSKSILVTKLCILIANLYGMEISPKVFS